MASPLAAARAEAKGSGAEALVASSLRAELCSAARNGTEQRSSEAATIHANVTRERFTVSPRFWIGRLARWSWSFQIRAEAKSADARGRGRAFALPFRRRASREPPRRPGHCRFPRDRKSVV